MTRTITHKYLRNLLDNLNDENYDDFLVELQYSTLIVPVGDVGLSMIKNKYLPLFTEFYEFDKFNRNEKYQPAIHDFNFYLELLKNDIVEGFIINPESEKFQISKDILKSILPNYIFDQEYQVFTANEIRQIKDSIENRDLNEFLKNTQNLWDLDILIEKINSSTVFTLLISDKDYDDENGVIITSELIPKCLYELGDKNYILLFSREISPDCISAYVFKYSQIVNFPLLVEEVLNNDFDGFILNIDEERVTIPRENLRNFMKDFKIPLLSDFSMYAFTLEGEQ